MRSDNFEHKLLPRYLRAHPEYDKWIYREPRGVLYEPHTGVEIPLGTREVKEYKFPLWRYDKILFIEKAGLWPAFKISRIAERYDMAIVAGEGVACEACRVLFKNADKGDYQLFVLHDADPYGYNIWRTLRDETPRMPGYNVDVCDLGLKLKEALDLGYEPEKASRKKQYPRELVPLLSDLEREYFDGEKVGRNSFIYKRVELDAFTGPDLIEYTERKLHDEKMRGKVIPPADSLPGLAQPIVAKIIDAQVQAEIRRLLSTDTISHQITDTFLNTLPLDRAHDWITSGFSSDPLQAWDHVLKERIAATVMERQAEIHQAVLAALKNGMELDL
jgi:hypothetical protein